MDIRHAERLSQYGGLAALLSACISAAVTFSVMYNLERNFNLTIGEMLAQDWWMFLGAGLFLALGIAVFRCSRAAAVALVLLYTGDRAATYMDTGSFQGLIVGVILLYFFVNAVRGTFAYHALMRADDPSHRAIKVWHFLVGLPAYLIIGGIVTLGMIERAGLMPALERFLDSSSG